jgi:hypothetical protein
MGSDTRLPTLLYVSNTAANEKEVKTGWLNFLRMVMAKKGCFPSDTDGKYV